MPAPTTVDDFLQFARKSGQLDGNRLDDYLGSSAEELPASPRKLAVQLIRAGVMTTFQAEQFLQRFKIVRRAVQEAKVGIQSATAQQDVQPSE